MSIKHSCLIVLCLCPGMLFALANPASVNCIKQGNKFLLKNSVGICMFKDKSYCEEWAYYRGACQKGQHFLKTKRQR